MSYWYMCVYGKCPFLHKDYSRFCFKTHDYDFHSSTGSTLAPQVQPWLIPVVVICACVLVLVCVAIVIVGVVVGLKRHSGKQART